MQMQQLQLNKFTKRLKKKKIKLNVKNWTNSYLKERKEFLFNRDKIKSEVQIFLFSQKDYLKQLRKVLPKNSAITLDAGHLCLTSY